MRRVFLVFNQSELIKHFEVNALSISDRVTASLSSDFCSTNSKLAFSFCFIRGKIHHGFFGGFFAHFIKIISSCLFKGLGMVHAGWCLLTLLGGWCNSEIVAGSCDQCPGKFIHICHHLQHIIKSWELKTVAVCSARHLVTWCSSSWKLSVSECMFETAGESLLLQQDSWEILKPLDSNWLL